MGRHKLQESLVMEIHARLPVKSLLRFRCVSKTWCARFQNSDFISVHCIKQMDLDNNNFDNSNLLLQQFGKNSTLENHMKNYTIFYSSLGIDHDLITVKENIYLPTVNEFQKCWSHVLGPVNGILCLLDGLNIGLWNPATREFKFLPKCTVSRPPLFVPPGNPMPVGIGFGYDKKNDTYKIIRLICNYYSVDADKFIQTELYTQSNNSWREIVSPHWEIDECFEFNKYINGACYWKCRISGRDNKTFLLSFDMTDEVFITTDFPDVVDTTLLTGLYIACIDQYPAAIAAYGGVTNLEKVYDVWILKELGVKESWIKKLVIGPIHGIEKPLGFWKNGKIFMKDNDQRVVLYDPSTQKLIHTQIYCKDQLIIYVESLTSIQGKKEITHVTKCVTWGVPRRRMSYHMKVPKIDQISKRRCKKVKEC